jgi:hypothetical protein
LPSPIRRLGSGQAFDGAAQSDRDQRERVARPVLAGGVTVTVVQA